MKQEFEDDFRNWKARLEQYGRRFNVKKAEYMKLFPKHTDQ